MPPKTQPIGVFDSGVGGLTVLKALREALPQEDYIYLGDTARLPYGTKGGATVTHYVLQAAQMLQEYDIKLLVIACNTATALALPALQNLLPDLPCLGVIEPSAQKAAELSATGRIAVLSTEGTARSRAYADAILRNRPDAHVRLLGCNLLVALAEEGWCEGAEAEAVVGRYLQQLGDGYDTLVLGCTHFPVLASVIRKLIPPHVQIVDSATTTAEMVRDYLSEHNVGKDRTSSLPLAGRVREGGHPLATCVQKLKQDSQSPSPLPNPPREGEGTPPLSTSSAHLNYGTTTFLATDLPERFALMAQRFLAVAELPQVMQVHLQPSLTTPHRVETLSA